MSHRLQMTDEVRSWLTGLRSRDLAGARLAGEAVIALLDEGAALGSPLVVAVEPALRAHDVGMALDHSYQRQLELLQRVRRSVADVVTSRRRVELHIGQLTGQEGKLGEQGAKAADIGRDDLAEEARTRQCAVREQLAEVGRQYAELQEAERQAEASAQRLQMRVDAFRTRKEGVKCAFIVGRAQAEIEEALADAGEEDAPSPDEAIATARLTVEAMLDDARELEQEARVAAGEETGPPDEALQPPLRELRLGALTGHDIRILFAIEPPGTVLLLAAAERGQGSRWLEWYQEALPFARHLLSGQAAHASYGRESFLREFFPAEEAQLDAGAARLVAGNRVRPLVDVRRRAGFTQAQLAERMGVREGWIAAIERADAGATEMRTLADYVQALGGRLEIVADFGAERINLG